MNGPTFFYTSDDDDFIIIITDADAPLEQRIKQLHRHAAQNQHCHYHYESALVEPVCIPDKPDRMSEDPDQNIYMYISQQ